MSAPSDPSTPDGLTADNTAPQNGLLLGRSCPHCGLASRLIAVDSDLAAGCLKCGGIFVGDAVLTRLAGARRTFPPTMPLMECSRLCPVCEDELYGVLVAGLAANVCRNEHGAFFDRARGELVTRMLTGTAPDVVAAGHATRAAPRRLSASDSAGHIRRAGYLRVFTDKPAQASSRFMTPYAAAAVVAALLALAYKLGA